MIGKIVGAVAGQQLSRQLRGVDGVAGALLGAGAVAVARRLGPAGMVAAALGSWLIMRNRGAAAEPVVHNLQGKAAPKKAPKKIGTTNARQNAAAEPDVNKPAKVQPTDRLAAASPAQ